MENILELRLMFFFGTLAVMCSLEFFWPRRKLKIERIDRWPNNFALMLLNGILMKLIFPMSAVGVASLAMEKGYGLFNMINLSGLTVIVLSVTLLDLIIYFQHILTHKVPLLWRLHRVHHIDPDYDVTTGARFHPIEIAFSMGIKIVAIVVLGISPLAVVIFEIVLNSSAMFNHANYKLPLGIDAWVRKLFVTPDMHRVHHSVIEEETNSNYGFFISVWDRVFGTYLEQPHHSHEKMVIGLSEFKDVKETVHIWGLLKVPFITKKY